MVESYLGRKRLIALEVAVVEERDCKRSEIENRSSGREESPSPGAEEGIWICSCYNACIQ